MNKFVGDKELRKIYVVPGEGQVFIKGFVKERKKAVRIYVCNVDDFNIIREDLHNEVLIGQTLRDSTKYLKQTIHNHHQMMKLTSGDTDG